MTRFGLLVTVSFLSFALAREAFRRDGDRLFRRLVTDLMILGPSAAILLLLSGLSGLAVSLVAPSPLLRIFQPIAVAITSLLVIQLAIVVLRARGRHESLLFRHLYYLGLATVAAGASLFIYGDAPLGTTILPASAVHGISVAFGIIFSESIRERIALQGGEPLVSGKPTIILSLILAGLVLVFVDVSLLRALVSA